MANQDIEHLENEIDAVATQIENSIDNEIEILEVPVEEMVVIKPDHLEIINSFDDTKLKNIIVYRLNNFKERIKDSTNEFLSVLIGSDLQIIFLAINSGRNVYTKDMSTDSGFVNIIGILDAYVKLLDESSKNPAVMLYNPETQQAEFIGNVETRTPYLAKEIIDSAKGQANAKK
ncbi:MAG: hypothetical protein E7171_07745 [Firmicutes bacterium]|nr:hypothetical protein [Bacillota bacterium]